MTKKELIQIKRNYYLKHKKEILKKAKEML